MPYIVYADIEFLIRKIYSCADNPEKSSVTKIGENIPWGYSRPTVWGFDHVENKHTFYDCMKTFCASLRKHVKNIIDFEKKKILPLTEKGLKSYQDAKACYIYGGKNPKKTL